MARLSTSVPAVNLRQKSAWLLSVAIATLALAHIFAVYGHQSLLVYLTKPGAMLGIIALAVLRARLSFGRYTILILAGLVCSLVGDVLLMVPADLFVAGLVAFLIAHLFYIAAFRTGLKRISPLWLAMPFYGTGAVMLWILSTGLGEMLVPVTIYLIVILTMAWQAFYRWRETRDQKALLAAAGAVLFVVSDSIIALNRFRAPFLLAEGLIMATYFSAQWLIALSCR
jgi:uncharacterized membrane protein YhhN